MAAADGRDLVLSLEGLDAEVLALRQLVEDVGGGRDRIRSPYTAAGPKRSSRDEAQRGRLVAGDVAVDAGLDGRLAHANGGPKISGGLGVRVAGVERLVVGLDEHGVLLELALDPASVASIGRS